MINLTNLLSRIWDHDNSTKKKHKKNEAKSLITKYQMKNLKIKNQFSINYCHVGRQQQKNIKVKYPTTKQFKTQTTQNKHNIKK